jgi:sarcosine oxidase subunit alpha
MTCRVPSADGLRVETQNVLGWREHDVLRVTDWFFPAGMNHHELMAGVPGAQRAMEAWARQIAGLGKLPSVAASPRSARRRSVDVLVVGAGPAGMAAAVEWARRGRAVEVLEDDAAWGRAARALDDAARPLAERWEPLLAAFEGAVRAGVTLRLRTTAVAIYGDDLLCASPEGVEVLETRTLVLAPGAHDGVLAFEGNDLPGVLSARAGCILLGYGVRPGKRVVVARAHEATSFADAYARMDPTAAVVRGVPTRARGSRRIRAATFAIPGDERPREMPCDALLLDAPRAPAYELCTAAGAELTRTPRGYLVRTGPGSAIRPSVLVVGEAAGTPLEPRAVLAEAAAMAR